ncbi:MAG: GNAT family N-acetyltransferase, partial [Actinobacteria bacterium]|nr:GNAT family N-acetyltransferase [Actinomycetota bacterium]
MYEVREVDIDDDAILSDWSRVVDDVMRHDVPNQPPWRHEELRGYHRLPWRTRAVAFFAAFSAGEMVGVANTRCSLVDTPHLLNFELRVHPDHRRRRVGTALLEKVIASARDLGRSTLLVEAESPAHGGGPDVDPGGGFAAHHGFKPALVNHHRVLRLPLTADLIDGLTRPDDDYEIVSWRDHLPEEWIEDRARLAARMVTD